MEYFDKEICICAAVIAMNGKIIRGHRHSDCISAMTVRGLKPMPRLEAQGFITSRGRFIGRIEAQKLQKAAGIPSEAGYRGDRLYSEDLY